MKKAIGIPLTPDRDNCYGIVVLSDGTFVGSHTSSNYSFLEFDLGSNAKAKDCDYFEFINSPPENEVQWLQIVNVLINHIHKIEERLEETNK